MVCLDHGGSSAVGPGSGRLSWRHGRTGVGAPLALRAKGMMILRILGYLVKKIISIFKDVKYHVNKTTLFIKTILSFGVMINLNETYRYS